jgi:organic radical activating enzyme
MSDYEKLTQRYSTFGDKLLQHTDVLYSIQNNKKFKPITVQLAPTETCDLNCNYCSVKNRDKSKSIDIETIKKGLTDFKTLGAKALEITGGGNPLLYHGINDVIDFAKKLSYDVGVITNSVVPTKYLSQQSIDALAWIRVSMSILDINLNANVNFSKISSSKLGLSYIINDKTTEAIIDKIASIASTYDVKFVRLAPNCLNDNSLTIKSDWNETIKKHNSRGKMFLKEINENFLPHDHCYVGLVRPYWTHSGVYICSSFVLATRKYEPDWKLCDVENVINFWRDCNNKFAAGSKPYDVDVNKCFHCYYYNNNKLLHTVATELPDKNFA